MTLFWIWFAGLVLIQIAGRLALLIVSVLWPAALAWAVVVGLWLASEWLVRRLGLA
jgi:hypothetical protein